ncbi:right-handed parallel beta-helix repeat-containing protein [Cohnella sp. GbtcB17]|uniref:right-handed parallel beta-helix repeat-containing protein n=1 Tax=Cohnella sp. GbtcB17 TaxID=2824762 RepID=UPI001C2FE92E|nr:right-handed parallel beta-helix repeat-containing protein [Cohnella sp. GbtcB17]
MKRVFGVGVKWLLVAMVALTGLIGLNPARTEASSAYFVATNGNDAWSGTLAAPNSAGTDGPFKTLAKARDAMRTGAVKTTYVRGGTYYMASTLVLNASDNGVKFSAYNGETPVLSGGQAVTGFAAEAGGLYAAPLSTPSDLELIVDGQRQRVAEKKSYDAANPYTYGHFFADANTALNKVVFKSGEMTAADFVSNLRIETYAVTRMQNDLLRVASIDEANRTINLTGNAKYAIGTNGTYRLLNNPAFIDEAGEFAYRVSDSKLVVKPANASTLLSKGAVVPRRTILSLDGADNVTIERMTFSDTPYSLPAVELKNGADLNGFYNNRLVNVGKGFMLTGSSDNTINHNEIAQTGGSGVEITYNADRNAINWNYIHHIGLVEKMGAGVWGYGVHDNRINNNRIEYTARYGISVKQWDAATDNSNNTIEYNKVLHTNRETSDTGAIEMLGRGAADTASKIQYNYIEDTGGLRPDWTQPIFRYPYGADGIYLDDETSGVTVLGNFIKDQSRAAVFVHAGDNNAIRNNVAIIGNAIWKGLGHEDGKDKFVRLEWGTNQRVSANNTIEKNIIYSKTASWPKYLDYFNGGTYTTDYNDLFNVPKVSGKDANSVISDPQFVNFGGGDYRLQPGSPAYPLGFVDLPWSAWNDTQNVAGIQPSTWVFYKGINLNGGAVTIEGNDWISHSAALSQGLSFPAGANLSANGTPLVPAPAADAATAGMLNTNVWKLGAALPINQTLPNGKYQIYFWVMENHQSNYRKFNVVLEGATVDADIGNMPINEWVKYGPYDVSVGDGVLNIELQNTLKDPMINGIAIYKRR